MSTSFVCDGCKEKRVGNAFCRRCLHKAVADAEEGFGIEDMRDTEGASEMVREWADRQRLLHGLPPEHVALLEQCAEDLRA